MDKNTLRRMAGITTVSEQLSAPGYKPSFNASEFRRLAGLPAVKESGVNPENIDSGLTQQWAQKIIDSLVKQFGPGLFESSRNKDGYITIKVKYGFADPSNDNNSGAITGKNFNKAANVFYDDFRKKGWTFTQPVDGAFMIGVPKSDKVHEASEESSEEEVPAEEAKEPSHEEIVAAVAEKAEGKTGEELVAIIKDVYDAGFKDGKESMEEKEEVKESATQEKNIVLSFLKMPDVTAVTLKNKEVEKIVNKHLKGHRDVFACQEELIAAGFEEYAKL